MCVAAVAGRGCVCGNPLPEEREREEGGGCACGVERGRGSAPAGARARITGGSPVACVRVCEVLPAACPHLPPPHSEKARRSTFHSCFLLSVNHPARASLFISLSHTAAPDINTAARSTLFEEQNKKGGRRGREGQTECGPPPPSPLPNAYSPRPSKEKRALTPTLTPDTHTHHPGNSSPATRNPTHTPTHANARNAGTRKAFVFIW